MKLNIESLSLAPTRSFPVTLRGLGQTGPTTIVDRIGNSKRGANTDCELQSSRVLRCCHFIQVFALPIPQPALRLNRCWPANPYAPCGPV